MKVLGLIAVIMLATACNNTAPTATVYKEQLGGAGAVVGTGNQSSAGDSANGQTLFTSNGCAGCHASGASNAFKAAVACDAAALAKSPVHNSFSANFSGKNGADITAYIKTLFPGSGGAAATGDATKGETLLKGTCEAACHPGAGPLDSFVDVDAQIAAASVTHDAATKKAMSDNLADLKAALKLRQ